MDRHTLYETLSTALAAALEEHGLTGSAVTIHARGLTPEEAIGHTQRTDYPILTGKEVMLMAGFRGAKGQAFTYAPARFEGALEQVLALDLEGDPHSQI